MAIKPVQIEIKANAADAVAGIGQVNQALNNTGEQAAEASKGLGKAQQSITGISESLSAAKAQLVAFIAAQLGLSGVREIAATADAYNNLQARVKLATGEGAAFTAAFSEVTETAIRTNSGLEQTGQLFAKLTEAGKSAGLSTQQAIDQALGLTETINQAIQLSGGSADSANAAVTQLVQGLQGGVLRGDEFNSVMEQSPRLAKALADGLGVTTGELRKMAEAGSLSAETVMGALKGQADTLKREFSTLPPTVGRALENLSTSWTLYVGETDKATGATSKAAYAIDALAANLGTVAGLLMDAGQAAAAFTALRLAQTFLGVGAAATQATVAVVANTAAVNAAGVAGTAATASVGRFAAMLGSLKTLSVLGIVTNFKDIGTAIGEGIAKLAGYKDGAKAMEQAEREAQIALKAGLEVRDRQTALNQAALEKTFELSKASRQLIADFDGLTAKGTTAAEAIGKIGKDLDLSSFEGIKTAGAALDKLAADGKISADQLRAAWMDALKEDDLAAFEVRARAAFAGSAREGERMAQVLDATLREAIRRTGLDFDLISGGMSKASRSAINDTEVLAAGLARLGDKGVDVARTLAASIGKSIQTADSQKALEAVSGQIEALRSKLGGKVADGLLEQAAQKARELKKALEDATPGVQSVEEAMRKLGVTSDAELKRTAESAKQAYTTMKDSGTASVRELQEAFKVYAEKAIAANAGVASDTLKAQAAMRGLEIATDGAGKAIVRAMGSGASSAQQMTDAARQTTEQLQAQTDALDRIAMKYKLSADYTERQISLLERENALLERRDELERKRLNIDKEGFSTDKSGNRVGMGGDLTTLTGISNFLKSAGVKDEETAKRIALEFSDGKGDIPYFSNPGQMKYGGAYSTISQALLKAAERHTFGSGAAVGAMRAPVAAGAPAASNGAARVVRINVNSTDYGEVRTDAQGAQTVENLIKELASAKLRS